MSSIKDQLLQLGFQVAARAALPSSTPSARPTPAPLSPHLKAKSAKRKGKEQPKSPPPPGGLAQVRKKAKKPRRPNGAPSFVTRAALPAAPRAAAKHPAAPSAPHESSTPNTQTDVRRGPAPISQATIDRLISDLSKRTMLELRQQWLNAIRRGEEPLAVRFRRAMLSEWARRTRHADTPADYFRWPSTRGGNGTGDGDFDHWHEQGVLKYLGYQVGITNGLSTASRRHILDAVFDSSLPPVNGANYIHDWAQPASAARLRRLAEEIARFVRNAQNKRSANMSSAIADWEEDLRYLHARYYVGRFNFAWP